MNNKSLISSMSKNNIMEKKDIINCYLLLTKYEYYINLLKKITRKSWFYLGWQYWFRTSNTTTAR